MTRALATLNRLVVFLTGLALVVAGLVPAALYWDVPYVSGPLHRLSRDRMAALPAEGWYLTALIAALVLSILLGLWFVLANIRNRGFNNREAEPADPKHGSTVLNVQRIAEAACQHVESSPLVQRASAAAALVGARPTATFHIVADPYYSFAEVAELIERTDRDFCEACRGVDIDTVYKLELDRISA